jgi:5'-3' exonuclease
MGVHGLVSFVENYNGDRLVNIKVKARRSQRSKVLVIDLLAMQYKFYQSFDLYNGGDSQACTEGWRTFITDLEKAKIKPIFVVDGSVPKTKRQEWIRRRYENVKKSINPIFDALKNGEYPDEDKIDSCVLPNMMFVDLIK